MSVNEPGWVGRFRRKSPDPPKYVDAQEHNRQLAAWATTHITGDKTKTDCCGKIFDTEETQIVPLTYCVSTGISEAGTMVAGWFTEYRVVGPCCLDSYVEGSERHEPGDTVERIDASLQAAAAVRSEEDHRGDEQDRPAQATVGGSE